MSNSNLLCVGCGVRGCLRLIYVGVLASVVELCYWLPRVTFEAIGNGIKRNFCIQINKYKLIIT